MKESSHRYNMASTTGTPAYVWYSHISQGVVPSLWNVRTRCDRSPNVNAGGRKKWLEWVVLRQLSAHMGSPIEGYGDDEGTQAAFPGLIGPGRRASKNLGGITLAIPLVSTIAGTWDKPGIPCIPTPSDMCSIGVAILPPQYLE